MSPAQSDMFDEVSWCSTDKPSCVALRSMAAGHIGIRNNFGRGSKTIAVSRRDLEVLFVQIKAGLTDGFTGTLQIEQIHPYEYVLYVSDNPLCRITFTAQEIANFFEGVRIGYFDECISRGFSANSTAAYHQPAPA